MLPWLRWLPCIAAAVWAIASIAVAVPASATVGPCTHTINATAGVGGSVSPSGPIVVACGDLRQFEISAEPCFTIADVVVDGVSRGPVTSYQFLFVSTDHTIQASFARLTFPITASAGPHGTISPNGVVQVSCGTSKTFMINPNPCYAVEQLLIDGASVGPLPVYTFEDVQTDHTIEASFVPLTYHLLAVAGAGGSISPPGNLVVGCGTTTSFSVTPAPCYAIDDVTIDDVSQGPLTSYAFTNVHADHTILARFAPVAITVTASAGTGGSISPSGAVAVTCGTDRSFTVTPDACHTILDVKVDGVSKGPLASYTMVNVRQPHTIAASFALRTFAFSAQAGPGGTITPGGAPPIGCGTNAVFQITAAPCHATSGVWVDGVSKGVIASYTFTNVTASHSIFATFTPLAVTITAGADPGGSIAPSGAVTVSCDGAMTFTIAVDSCRAVRDVLVDGVSVGAVTSYTFDAVAAPHTIQARFEYAADGPPVVTGLTASTPSLAPADHALRDVTIDYAVSDCSPVATTLSVTSSEPVTGTSDGDVAPDWEVIDAHHVRLRAERAVGAGVRVYTVTVTSVDSTGETSVWSIPVVVALNIVSPPSGTIVRMGTPVALQGAFWDATGPAHQATWTIDTATIPGIITEPLALQPGSVSASYAPPASGVYEVQLDVGGGAGGPMATGLNDDVREVVVAYDSTKGYAAAGGWYASPAGAFVPDTATGKMGFGFVAKFNKNPASPGAPTGEVRFRMLRTGFEFTSTTLSAIVINGAFVRITGTGTVTGDPQACSFLLSCVDGGIQGGTTDRLRLRVTHTSSGTLVYDTQPGDADAANPTLFVGNTASVVHGYQGVLYTTDVPADGPALVVFALEQSRPNPAHGGCWVRYALPARSRVRLTLFDVTGREVARLADGERGAGAWAARVDGAGLPGGVYFYRLEASRLDGRGARFTQTRRMLLLP